MVDMQTGRRVVQAALTWRINHVGTVYKEDVGLLLTRIIQGQGGAPAPGGLDVLAASPPCQVRANGTAP